MSEQNEDTKPVYCRKVAGRICELWKGNGCLALEQGPGGRCKHATDYDPTEKFEYGTKEEAERRRRERINKIPDTQCPLANDMCTASCVCYEIPKVVNIGSKDSPVWDCRGGRCTAYCLVGPT